jgi:hypothetical protein
VVAHLNPYLPHQVEHGEMLKQGFKRHGIELDVTADKLKAGDIHIVSGPWYALNEWQGKRELQLKIVDFKGLSS